MISKASSKGTPKQQLTLVDAVSIIVGIVIGAGIYETTPLIVQNLSGHGEFITVWLVGGLLSLIGALCYAELTTRFPHEGGDYVFLSRAYGRRMGFLFTWTGFWIVHPANTAAIAFIFARYAENIMPLYSNGYDLMIYAVAGVISLTAINLGGVKSGKLTQNLLTMIKVAGLLIVTAVGLWLVTPAATPVAISKTGGVNNIALAMILVLFTYGGWSNISFVAAEVIRPGRNLLRALTLGIALITAIYLLTTMAFIQALGFDNAGQSESIASDVVTPVFGQVGSVFISLLICITCLGNINGMIFTNARIYYAMGREHRLYAWIGKWNEKADTPMRALVLQSLVTLILIVVLGTDGDAFTRLVVFSSPIHWLFFFLVGISLFLFRLADKTPGRHYKVPFYPVLPVLFCASTLFMLYASISYAYGQRYPEAYWIAIIVILGIVAGLAGPAGKDQQ